MTVEEEMMLLLGQTNVYVSGLHTDMEHINNFIEMVVLTRQKYNLASETTQMHHICCGDWSISTVGNVPIASPVVASIISKLWNQELERLKSTIEYWEVVETDEWTYTESKGIFLDHNKACIRCAMLVPAATAMIKVVHHVPPVIAQEAATLHGHCE